MVYDARWKFSRIKKMNILTRVPDSNLNWIRKTSFFVLILNFTWKLDSIQKITDFSWKCFLSRKTDLLLFYLKSFFPGLIQNRLRWINYAYHMMCCAVLCFLSTLGGCFGHVPFLIINTSPMSLCTHSYWLYE